MELKTTAPQVTFYDDATGERLEFSKRTLDNWIDKTANLLVDGLGAQPGDRIALDLPLHWQKAVWFYAAWKAGLHVADTDPDILVTDRPQGADADEIVGLSLSAFGEPLSGIESHVTDYATEVRAYGDRFTAYTSPAPDAPVLTVTNTTLSRSQLGELTERTILEHCLDTADRVLVTINLDSVQELVLGLLAPIAAGGSVILCRNINVDVVERRLEMEHVTAVAGPDVPYASLRRVR